MSSFSVKVHLSSVDFVHEAAPVVGREGDSPFGVFIQLIGYTNHVISTANQGALFWGIPH